MLLRLLQRLAAVTIAFHAPKKPGVQLAAPKSGQGSRVHGHKTDLLKKGNAYNRGVSKGFLGGCYGRGALVFLGPIPRAKERYLHLTQTNDF